MSKLDSFLKRYLVLKNLNKCSCTIPYENLKLFRNLDLFTTLVVIISSNNKYVQKLSLLNLELYNGFRIDTIVVDDFNNEAGSQQRTTQLYTLLPPFPQEGNCLITECLLKLLSGRIRLHSCSLLASSVATPDLISHLRNYSANYIVDIQSIARTKKFVLTEIISRSESSNEDQGSKTWFDEEGEELEEEV